MSINDPWDFKIDTAGSGSTINWGDSTSSSNITWTTGTITAGSSSNWWIDSNPGYSITADVNVWSTPKSVREQIADAKATDELKVEHGLEEFHIVLEHDLSDWLDNPAAYLFLTRAEMECAKRYGIQAREVSSPEEFNAMLCAIEDKNAKLTLSVSGETYETIEDLRKDYLVLKLAGVEE